MSKPDPKYLTPLAGDIILCGASWNIHAQRALRPGGLTDYSHAAVMCSINFGIQAMPGSGVDAFGLHEFLSAQVAGSPWRVYRHKEFDARAKSGCDVDIMMHFREAAKYFMGQRYNFGINLPERSGSTDNSERSFCSQLVARIYEKACELRPHARIFTSTVLPSDLQSHFAKNDDWLDVTSIYSQRMEWVINNERLSSAITDDSASIEILRNDLKLLLAFQKTLARDEAELASFESAVSSLEKPVSRLYKRVTGTPLRPMPPLNMTNHLMQALERGAHSNWRARKMFKGYQWRLRLRKIWLAIKRHRN